MAAIGNLPTTVTTAEDVERFVSLDHLEPGDLRIPVGVMWRTAGHQNDEQNN
jgi:hypothetical protein